MRRSPLALGTFQWIVISRRLKQDGAVNGWGAVGGGGAAVAAAGA